MVDKHDTLRILNHEKEYEDQLAADLNAYFIDSLSAINNLSDYEKERIRTDLGLIAVDSLRHKQRFVELIQYVIENGEDNF